MLLISSRSSRLFLVLLHLIGVCHLPSSLPYWSETGIVGVNPFSIVLERLDPLTLLHVDDQEEEHYKIPHWLQDSTDGRCLDPLAGFSDCGDATLWLLLPRQRKDARKRQLLRWATEQDDDDLGDSSTQGFALQLVDDDNYLRAVPTATGTASSSTTSTEEVDVTKKPSTPNLKERHVNKECLTRRRKDNKLLLAPCSQQRAWSWHVNSQGVLHFQYPSSSWFSYSSNSNKGSSRKTNRQRLKRDANEDQANQSQNSLNCIWRNSSSHAILSPCNGQAQVNVTADSSEESPQVLQQVVQFALIRQATTDLTVSSTSTSYPSPLPSSVPSSPSSLPSSSDDPVNITQTSVSEPPSIPSSSEGDIAHSHASRSTSGIKTQHRLTTTSSRLLFADPSHLNNKGSAGAAPSATPSQADRKDAIRTPSKPSSPAPQNLPLHFFKNTNPILLASGRVLATDSPAKGETSKKSSGSDNQSKQHAKTASAQSDASASSSTPGSQSIRALRKIRVHPYIQAAKDEVWTDPLTGLEYRTDLCRYLGDDRKENGRHTLTGVGQYMKTVFNIKVYGVSFYVSKRDVLADETMEPYASLSSEELRARPDFFDVLRLMGDSSPHCNIRGGLFDRTLLLKTNMQLSTETMRSSLEADWKMLTEENTQTLVNSSLKARPASERTLEIIRSPNNPSRCSCAQIAPAEYDADPSCCARGTELAFTWRKTGALEIRLDGELVDSFPRPDIAEGIFFEYLRLDDPMSTDFLDHVVDGFPFLLAPLSQVKGVSTPVRQQAAAGSSSVSKGATSLTNNPVVKAIGGLSDVVSSHAMGFAGFVQSSANEMTNNAVNTARSVGDAARQLGEEMDRRRGALGKHVSSMAHSALSSWYVRDSQKALEVAFPEWLGRDGRRQFFLSRLGVESEGDTASSSGSSNHQNAPRGRVFGHPFARFFGDDSATPTAPDEIVPMIHPSANSTQRVFFGLVHLYLLLLLIVSFPAQLTTRTKLIVIRRASQSVQHNDMTDSSESEMSSDLNYTPRSRDPTSGRKFEDDHHRCRHHHSAGPGTQTSRPIHRILKTSGSPSSPRRFRTLRFRRTPNNERINNDDDDVKIKKSLSYVL